MRRFRPSSTVVLYSGGKGNHQHRLRSRVTQVHGPSSGPEAPAVFSSSRTPSAPSPSPPPRPSALTAHEWEAVYQRPDLSSRSSGLYSLAEFEKQSQTKGSRWTTQELEAFRIFPRTGQSSEKVMSWPSLRGVNGEFSKRGTSVRRSAQSAGAASD